MFRFLVTALLVSYAYSQVIPENPCPNIFSYRQQRGVYFGVIDIPFDGSKNLNLAVNISMVGLYQNLKLNLQLLTPAEQILSSSLITYRVNFPVQNVVPRITQIAFNGRIYCYGPAEPVGMNGVTNLWANLVYKINQYTYNVPNRPIDSSNIPFTSNNVNEPNQNTFVGSNNAPVVAPSANDINAAATPLRPSATSTEESCGISNDIQTLVLKGKETIENEYPWLVAMFHRQGVSYDFQCTANLISKRHVITAAHCVWFYKAPLIAKEDILLVIGRSDISRWASTDALIRTALEVIPHPNYQQNSAHCDLAIIKMNEEVTFRPTVRPICLWNGDTNLKQIVGTEGIVAGWGKTEEAHKVVAVPRKVAMPIVSQETCLRSHADFKNLTSNMTFCSGNRDGSGPCSGDSGAGFIIKKSGIWYLRGLVSTAIKNDDYSCNLNEYIVFADVAKLEDWIKSAMK